MPLWSNGAIAAALASSAQAANQPATAGTTAEAKLKERPSKISTVNDVIDMGNAIRVGNFRAQTTRDPKLHQETQARFTEIDKKLADLRSTTRQADNLKQLDDINAAGNAYKQSMASFLTNWLAREELAKKHDGRRRCPDRSQRHRPCRHEGHAHHVHPGSQLPLAGLGDPPASAIAGIGIPKSASTPACLSTTFPVVSPPLREEKD